MVVVAFLDRPHFGFEPQNLRAIFAHHTGRRRDIAEGRMPGAFFGGKRGTFGR